MELACFEQIAEQYTPMIYKIINSLHIYKNKDEFYQTGLIALWEACTNFDKSKGSLTSYAYSFIKGKIMTELSKSKKQEERSVYPDEAYWDTLRDEQPGTPFETDFLQSFCSDLTEKESKWLLYTCLNGFSIREIAQREQVTVSAVKQWRSNARRKLQRRKIE